MQLRTGDRGKAAGLQPYLRGSPWSTATLDARVPRWPLLLCPPPPPTHLLEDLSCHQVAAVKDDAEFPAPLHLLQQRPGIVGVQRELADFQPDIVP